MIHLNLKNTKKATLNDVAFFVIVKPGRHSDKQKSLTDRELITLTRQHNCRSRLLDDPEVDVKL
jgi:hypothetical protein